MTIKLNSGCFKKGHIPWNKGNGVYKVCLSCNKRFYLIRYRLLEGRGKFCSLKCRRAYTKIKAKTFKITPDMAELIGVIIGDGCISKYSHTNGYRIFISGNPIEDKHYMEEYLPRLLKKCLGNEKKPFIASNGAYVLQFANESFRLFLKDLGIGEKKARTIGIPKKIGRNPILLRRCIRGIADTDFTLIFTKKHNYPRITAQFASDRLVRDIETSLRNFGFTLNTSYNSEIKDKRGYNWITNRIHLDGPHNLRKWMEEIGFSNLRIISRYEVWKKNGQLMPRTTLPERLKELGWQGVVQNE